MGHVVHAESDDDLLDDPAGTESTPPVTPDIREDEIPLKIQSGDKMIVPVPFSNPTLDTGLVAGHRCDFDIQ